MNISHTCFVGLRPVVGSMLQNCPTLSPSLSEQGRETVRQCLNPHALSSPRHVAALNAKISIPMVCSKPVLEWAHVPTPCLTAFVARACPHSLQQRTSNPRLAATGRPGRQSGPGTDGR